MCIRHTRSGVGSHHGLGAGLLQGPDVVDDVHAQIQRFLHGLGLVGVHRKRHIPAYSFSQKTLDAAPLLIGGHHRRAWPGGFPSDVEHLRTVAQQLLGMAQPCLGGIVSATVRERVGREVDNPHHTGRFQVDVKAAGLPDHGRTRRSGSVFLFAIHGQDPGIHGFPGLAGE